VSAPAANEITARAVWFVAPYQVEIREAPPAALRPGELLVRTEFSGISAGTELLAYRGQLDPRVPRDETLTVLGGTFAYPFTYGYSVVGTVEASRCDVGEGARVFAFAPHQDRLVVSGADVVPIAGADARAATLFPLVETALQVTLDAGVRYGEVVVVLGLGPVGILTSMLLARSGATVVASDPKPWRRQLAQRCGIAAIEPEALSEAASTVTGNRGVDVLVEASGNPAALAGSLDVLAHEGVAVVASWYGSKPVTLPLGAAFHRRRLEIRSSQVSTVGGRARRWDRRRRRDAARGLLDALPLSALASHSFPFERAADAYATLDREDEGVVHAALAYA
jgi:2-desacetyl-2-hydroxyethyl bacteriochlorophyllide A dehydrogenase